MCCYYSDDNDYIDLVLGVLFFLFIYFPGLLSVCYLSLLKHFFYTDKIEKG